VHVIALPRGADGYTLFLRECIIKIRKNTRHFVVYTDKAGLCGSMVADWHPAPVQQLSILSKHTMRHDEWPGKIALLFKPSLI
jgi:hypothetical protein